MCLLGVVFGFLLSSLAGLVLLIDAPARRAMRARSLRAEVERWAGPSVTAVTVNFRRDDRVVRRVRADLAWARRLRLNGMHESRFAWRRAVCGNRIVRIFRNRWRRLFRFYNDTRRNLRTDAAPARGWPMVVRDGRDPPCGTTVPRRLRRCLVVARDIFGLEYSFSRVRISRDHPALPGLEVLVVSLTSYCQRSLGERT